MADTFCASIVCYEGGSPDVGGSGNRPPAGHPDMDTSARLEEGIEEALTMKRLIRVAVAMLTPLLVLVANGAAFGQELPPGPTTVYRTSLPGQTINGEFELINIILDFGPGAATPPHVHGGPGLALVTEGEIVFGMQDRPEWTEKPGGFYPDLPGMVHTAANKTGTGALMSYIVALPKGAPLTTVVGGPASGDPPPGPKTVYRNSLPGLTLQGEFELINLILDFAPGAATPMHTHGGPGIVTILEGELVFAPQGKPEIVARPGEVYLDVPGTHHTAVNKSTAPARVSYAVLLPKGATLTTVDAAAPSQAPAPVQQPAANGGQIGMPRTGHDDSGALTLALVIAAGLLVVGIASRARFTTARLQD